MEFHSCHPELGNRFNGYGRRWTVAGLIKGRDGTRPAFRVGQVDAELLDEELLGLLKGQVVIDSMDMADAGRWPG
jgi:hypothetical protein